MAGQSRTTPDGVTHVHAPPAAPAPGVDAARAPDAEDVRRREASRAEGELLDLIARVGDEPWAFDFFQLMRRVEALSALAKRAPGVGRSSRAKEDPVRFGQEPSLAFAPRTISGVKTRAGVTRMFVNFMGLLGPQGPMPLHFTEYVRSRELHHQDPTWSRFLDIFNNRMVALLYRAWAMNRPIVSRDASFTGQPERDRFASYVGSLFGMGVRGLTDRDDLDDDAKRFFAGRLANQTRSAEGLHAILRRYFDVPVKIDEFIGRWCDLPDLYHTRLGRLGVSGLGTTAILGSRVWECQSTVRVTLGPMTLDQYERLLPGQPGYDRLTSWLRMFGGDELGWEIVLVLRKEETPAPRLGSGPGAVRLGYSGWLSSAKPAEDPADLVLQH